MAGPGEDALELVRRRLVAQQLSAPRLTKPAELVRWMGAVQAQDYGSSLWGLGVRLPAAVRPEIEAAIAARTIVRTWPMRGTLHFVPAADARWMLKLLTPRVVARSAGRYRALELDEAAFARSARLLVRALEGHRSLTRPEAYATLRRGGVSPDGQRGIHVLGHLSQQGLLCQGPRSGRQPTFVLLDEWIRRSHEPAREAALATLATRYFSSHGPATLADFVWWSGLRVKEAQQGIDAAGRALVRGAREGLSFWSALSPRASARRQPSAWLLPPWDEYVVAYREREVPLGRFDADPLRYGAIGRPLILIDGRVRGTWKISSAAGAFRVVTDFWTAVTAAERCAVSEAATRHGRFLGVEVRV